MIKKISLSLALTALCASQAQAVTGAEIYQTFLSTKTRKALTLSGVVGSALGATYLGFATHNYLSADKESRNVLGSCKDACDNVFVAPFNWVKADYWRMGLAAAVTAATGYGLYKYFQMPQQDEQPTNVLKTQQADAVKTAQEKVAQEKIAQEKLAQEKVAQEKAAQEKTDKEYAVLVRQHGPRKAFEIKHKLERFNTALHGSLVNYRALVAQARLLPIR